MTSKPHPQSYLPDLPTFGFTASQLLKPTKEDKAYWAANPITMSTYIKTCCLPSGVCRCCRDKVASEKHIAKARAQFDVLNIQADWLADVAAR